MVFRCSAIGSKLAAFKKLVTHRSFDPQQADPPDITVGYHVFWCCMCGACDPALATYHETLAVKGLREFQKALLFLRLLQWIFLMFKTEFEGVSLASVTKGAPKEECGFPLIFYLSKSIDTRSKINPLNP